MEPQAALLAPLRRKAGLPIPKYPGFLAKARKLCNFHRLQELDTSFTPVHFPKAYDFQ